MSKVLKKKVEPEFALFVFKELPLTSPVLSLHQSLTAPRLSTPRGFITFVIVVKMNDVSEAVGITPDIISF